MQWVAPLLVFALVLTTLVAARTRNLLLAMVAGVAPVQLLRRLSGAGA